MALLPSGDDLVATTSQTGHILLKALIIYSAARFLYGIWLYPFHLSPLRHLPKPKVSH